MKAILQSSNSLSRNPKPGQSAFSAAEEFLVLPASETKGTKHGKMAPWTSSLTLSTKKGGLASQ